MNKIHRTVWPEAHQAFVAPAPAVCPEPQAAANRKTFMHRLRAAVGAMLAMLLLTLALQPLSAQAAWTQATGTVGISFESISKVGTTIYAGAAAGGLYQSTDDGATFTAAFSSTFNAGTPWTPLVVKQIGSVLYVGGRVGWQAGDARLAYSTNSGTTWTTVTAVTWGDAKAIHDIVLMNGATFVAANGSGVYKSIANNGTGWALSNMGMETQSQPIKFAQIGTTIYVGDISNNGTDGVYRSTDNGATWARASGDPGNSTELPATGNAGGQLVNYSGTLYFLTGAGGVWQSPNGGDNWLQSTTIGDRDCQRRLNIDPPCRSNIDPGRVAEF